MVLQPLLTARWYVVRRAQAIRAIEKLHGTRVITMIHHQGEAQPFRFFRFPAHRSGRCPDNNCGDQGYAGRARPRNRIGKVLVRMVFDHKAGLQFVDRPGRRKSARRHLLNL
jgi:hypothetical protein